jgi:NADH-quinone oxidoreductase subunit E
MEGCCCSKDKSDLSLMESVFERYSGDDHALVAILQEAQQIYGFLPADVIYHIAGRRGLTPAKVMGVATFYSQFRFKPVGKYLILLCKGTACHVHGADAIAATIKEELGIADGDTTADMLFSLKEVACLGCCSLSPVMMVNDTTYGSLTPQKVREIIAQLKAGGVS